MELTKTLEKLKSYLLQGAYQGAGHVLNSAIFEAMSIQSEFETLSVRVGEMAAEIERLQGVIDEANAQEAYGWDSAGDLVYDIDTALKSPAPIPLYARPIPAQQSPAVAVLA